jgi:hypothetical protein
MTLYHPKEQIYLNNIRERIGQLQSFLNNNALPDDSDIGLLFAFVEELRGILGNSANLQSFLSILLAKAYLLARFEIDDFDAAEKAQGASGLDIDVLTRTRQRIVGEIKSTIPYGEKDLGAAQKKEFRKDFAKLNAAQADYKFFFVTHQATYNIVQRRYLNEIPNIEIVLLTASDGKARQ